MKLGETYINLTGFFKCSIENNLVLCTGAGVTHTDPETKEPTVDLYVFDILDPINRTFISPSILVGFNQVEDKIMFLYKKDKFELISVSNKLITVNKDGIDYFIERIDNPFS